LPNQASGALSSLATVDALARIPRGAGTLEAGTRVTILPLSDVALRAALAAT
jgi:molybdopterin biosynthesis enzyme